MEAGFVTVMSARPVSRRQMLRFAGLGLALTCATPRTDPAFALKPGKPSKEKLLRGTREGKSEEEIEEEKARLAEERKVRLEKQRELQAAAERKKAGLDDTRGDETEIESNLRGQYYFPTARKRYLPRVKRAWDAFPAVEKAVRENQWSAVSNLCTSDLLESVLPMRLYASSLAGGGLSINARFIEKMNSETTAYENALNRLTTAAKRKDSNDALNRVVEMKAALQGYRDFGHLEAADFGIGEIPTDTRVGSGFGNNNSALYARNKSIKDVVKDNTGEQ